MQVARFRMRRSPVGGGSSRRLRSPFCYLGWALVGKRRRLGRVGHWVVGELLAMAGLLERREGVAMVGREAGLSLLTGVERRWHRLCAGLRGRLGLGPVPRPLGGVIPAQGSRGWGPRRL